MYHVNILSLFSPAGHSESSFDTVLSGLLNPPSLCHNSDILAEIVRILKPSGTFVLVEPVTLQGRSCDVV